jgi:excisionase family DNA binding protein
VDTSRSDEVRGVARMTIEEAARNLGIKEESVRKRVRRGRMRSEKDEGGRLYVYVDAIEAAGDECVDESEGRYAERSVDEFRGVARELIESKDETIRILQDQLQEEREARRRADAIVAQLTRANAALAGGAPELEAPPAPPRRAPEGLRGAAEPEFDPQRPHSVGQEIPAGSRGPWWSRWFGE